MDIKQQWEQGGSLKTFVNDSFSFVFRIEEFNQKWDFDELRKNAKEWYSLAPEL